MNALQQALTCASLGYYVVPGVGDRAHITGTYEGTTDIQTIKKWFKTNPTRNIKINMKNSNLVCFDLDRHNKSQDGLQAFKDLLDKYEGEVDTYVEKTPRNGLHIFYSLPEEFKNKALVTELGNGIEVKSIPIPIYPSRRSDGKYVPVISNGTPLTINDIKECPTWLLKLIIKPESVLNPTGALPISQSYTAKMLELFNSKNAEGTRNKSAYQLLSYWRKIGVSPSTCMDLLQEFNNKCQPPMDTSELVSIWKSVWKDKL